ncbi:hypothetical protein GCM10027598_31240 [Amycolatopsis oliviviridis]|uniref:Uncharacterized protein n=1 Tax=Amycolatopsis oliviviridis TaxID=1471590 RepID=A0ABQ3LUK1_9PSEU|nr:hypothetical protein [Amycolatopsis oliviviridis]GHH24500.1 hypothetical protein GCM10017790_48920 [Amycolatopsis oliviviridis]
MGEPINAARQREQPPIFRAEAVAHHRLGREEKPALPEEAPPTTFRRPWAVLGTLAAVLAIGVATMPVPVHRQGTAVARTAEPMSLVVVMPVSRAGGPAEGAAVVLREGTVRGRVIQRFGGVSRGALTARFGIPVTGELPDPATVAIVRLDTGVVQPGGHHPAWVEVGTASLLDHFTGRTDE